MNRPPIHSADANAADRQDLQQAPKAEPMIADQLIFDVWVGRMKRRRPADLEQRQDALKGYP